MVDLIFGIAMIAGGYFLDFSFFKGEPEKVFYAFDLLGGFLILSGIYKLFFPKSREI